MSVYAQLLQVTGTMNLPIKCSRRKTLGLIEHCLERDIDVCYSYQMQADHGFTQPLDLLCQGQLNHYPIIQVFMSGAAAPLPRTKRVIELGKVIGEYLKTLDERVLIISSGDLSHDPPPHQVSTAAPEAIRQQKHVIIANPKSLQSNNILQMLTYQPRYQ